ncbi:hypothetical protein ASG01_08585 [Chryseobacterium sp. Leaf180]|uniref:WxL protein host-binding domain-containing protein n=1 Tax=Chryseobacterium sp. Leaf180 TaxID=1736289 RepID=UPI0006FF94CA|nr:DUF3324 domain-containing protein [Chryseobacterium sp. Leaf180]KQR93904.1 hypothetical protein ASG01_08585 [Chryseobacterium sp. Leaf180]
MLKKLLFFALFVLYFQNVTAGIVILNGLSHTYKVENGKVYQGSLEIENTGTAPQNVKIFLQDLNYTSDGTIQYSAPLSSSKSNAKWIKINTNLLTLKGKEKTVVRYEITVPQSVAGSGSFWSVIMVEPVDDIKPSDKQAGINITSIVRYAVQIITDYKSEDAKPEFKFEKVRVDSQDKKKILKIAIANTGNLFTKAIASVEIYNSKNGEKLGTFSSQALGLLPGTSKTFDIDISKMAASKYAAVVLATDEDDNAFALNVELDVK